MRLTKKVYQIRGEVLSEHWIPFKSVFALSKDNEPRIALVDFFSQHPSRSLPGLCGLRALPGTRRTSCDPERGSPQRRWNRQRAPRHLANIIEKQNSYQRIHVYAHKVTTRLALPPAEVSILNMQRSGTVTDEPDPLYHVGASPDFSTKGLHLVSQEKYNTWVSGEKQQSRTRRWTATGIQLSAPSLGPDRCHRKNIDACGVGSSNGLLQAICVGLLWRDQHGRLTSDSRQHRVLAGSSQLHGITMWQRSQIRTSLRNERRGTTWISLQRPSIGESNKQSKIGPITTRTCIRAWAAGRELPLHEQREKKVMSSQHHQALHGKAKVLGYGGLAL